VEHVFDFKEVSNGRKVKVVVPRFASAWWEQLKVRRERIGKPKIVTWEKMKKELKRTFLPENYLQDAYMRLYNLRQGCR